MYTDEWRRLNEVWLQSSTPLSAAWPDLRRSPRVPPPRPGGWRAKPSDLRSSPCAAPRATSFARHRGGHGGATAVPPPRRGRRRWPRPTLSEPEVVGALDAFYDDAAAGSRSLSGRETAPDR